MDLVGAWLRQLLQAGTAAALVPAAMVAALAVVLIGAGGFGGLDSLGQLVSGPQVTAAERLASSDRPGERPDVAPLAPAGADVDRLPRAAAPAGSDAPRATAPPAGGTTPPPPTRPGVDAGDPPVVRPPPPPVIEPPAPPPPPPPAVARQPTLKDRTVVLGDKLKETVGEVGTAVQEIVDGLGQNLGRIINPPR